MPASWARRDRVVAVRGNRCSSEGGLGEGCQREIWKKIMKTMSFGYVSELRQEFRAEGLADGIIALLDKRGVRFSDADRERITSCLDPEQLQAWLLKTPYVSNIEDLFKDG
ncbi:hypothetical protein L0U85_10675 [Glycomyces sp. L485]|uniref:hypothetical protein n=1 Tax=Glycomyces sp. L485 TaxID=2909235 RepID=UPI001F4A6935|nr:hypothetical protein [Glycomyces sp. L485]MCH7231309.1 hypothetical protein [Glycomyces sp. L485]